MSLFNREKNDFIDFHTSNNRSNLPAKPQLSILISFTNKLLFIKIQSEINLSLLHL